MHLIGASIESRSGSIKTLTTEKTNADQPISRSALLKCTSEPNSRRRSSPEEKTLRRERNRLADEFGLRNECGKHKLRAFRIYFTLRESSKTPSPYERNVESFSFPHTFLVQEL